jgi:hypothetical protein
LSRTSWAITLAMVTPVALLLGLVLLVKVFG